MKRGLLVLVILTGILAVTALLWKNSPAPTSPDVPLPLGTLGALDVPGPAPSIHEADDLRAQQRRTVDSAAREEGADSTSADTELRATLAVRAVCDADDAPVSGARIEAWVLHAGRPTVTLEGTTELDGMWQVDILAPVEVEGLTVSPTALLPGGAFTDRFSLGAGERKVVEVRIPSPGSLSGTVVDETGSKVAGASVQCWLKAPMALTYMPAASPDRAVEADSLGGFQIEAVAGMFILRAHSPGRDSAAWVWGKLSPAQEVAGLVLRVSPKRAVVGLITNERGDPVQDVLVAFHGKLSEEPRPLWENGPPEGVSFNQCSPGFSGASDAYGRVEIQPAFELGLRATARHPDYVPASEDIQPGQGEFAVTLLAGLGLSGTVVSPAGSPVAGAEIELYGRERKSAVTNEFGQFKMSGLSSENVEDTTVPESLILATRSSGFAIHIQEIVTRSEMEEPLVIRLEAGKSIDGTVIDEGGWAVPGAWIHIKGDRRVQRDFAARGEDQGRTWERVFRYDRFATDSSGRFRIRDLYSGVFHLTVRLPGSDEAMVQVEVTSGEEDVEIRLGTGIEKVATLSGQVLDSATLDPIRDFRVKLEPWSSSEFMHFSNPRGWFEIGAIPPGDLRVTVEAEQSGLMTRVLLRELGVGPQERTFLLQPPRLLKLLVLDTQGQPARRGIVEVHDSEDRTLGDYRSPGLLTVGGVDENGRVDLGGLPAVPVTVAIRVVGPNGGRTKVVFDLRSPILEVQEVQIPMKPVD